MRQYEVRKQESMDHEMIERGIRLFDLGVHGISQAAINAAAAAMRVAKDI